LRQKVFPAKETALSVIYQFDDRGNLSPYALIPINDLSEFEGFFVNNFPISSTRNAIYSGLLLYLNDFGDTLRQLNYTGQWRIWLNGSFTTNKLSPVDIDVVNILTDDAILRDNKLRFKPFFAHNARKTYGVDAYFLLENTTNQAKELLTYWQNWLGVDRSGFPKGIIELAINL
jgi:hypothetical protein